MDDELQTSGHHVNQSVYWLLLRLLSLLFLLETLFVVLLAISLSRIAGQNHTLTIYILWAAQTLKFVVACVSLVGTVVPWATTHYYLRGSHLVVYTGLTKRREKTHELGLLKSLSLRQGFLGRLFDYGDLTLTVASSGFREDITLSGIYSPKRYERILQAFLPTN